MADDSEPGPPAVGRPTPSVPDDLAPECSEIELVADIWAADSHAARSHALLTLGVARLARRRRRTDLMARGARGGPGRDSRALSDPVLADISEDFVTELALTRGCSEHEARELARESILLMTVLQPAWSELYAGRIGRRHVAAIVDLLGDADPDVAAAVQAEVLPRAEGMTATVLRERVRYHLYRLDAEAKERRRREAARQADVRMWHRDDGMSSLIVDGPTPQVFAAYDAIDTYARMLRADGDDRPIGVLRSSVAIDLALRPWDTSRPPVTAELVIHARARALRPDGDPAQTQDPCEVDGTVVSAAQCRELLAELDLLGLGMLPAGGSVHVAVGHPVTGEVLAVAARAELRRAAGTRRRRRRRGGPGPTRRSGTGLRESVLPSPVDTPDGPGLRPPPDARGYAPTVAQKRHVKIRDRRCRMPACRRRPGRCDLDHVEPHADGGATSCWNLCCLCRRHHRIKTFAQGWSFRLLCDGTLVVRTPAGVSRETRPPGWYPEPEPEPPWLDETAPPDPLRC